MLANNHNLTTENLLLPPELTELLALTRKVANLPYYRHTFSSPADKEQTVWLIALEVYAKLEAEELQLVLTGTAGHPTHKKLWKLLDAKIQRECQKNGYHKFHFKDVRYTSAWLPQAITFTDYLANNTEVDQPEENLAAITALPLTEPQDWSWQELLQPTQQQQVEIAIPTDISVSTPLPLTPREYEVMIVFLIPNTKRKEAASYLNISLQTLKDHLERVFKKFKAHTLKDARREFIETYRLQELVADY